MLLTDVNVLVYAHREDAPDHAAFRRWVEKTLESDEAFGLADIVLSRFVRVVTHPRVFNPPSRMSDALRFVDALRTAVNCVQISRGPRHWEIFTKLCRLPGIKGNLVADAYLAALAIESGCEWVTTDRDFARFPGLRWRHPLD